MPRLHLLLLLGLLCINQQLLAQYQGVTPFCHQRGGLLINEISNGPISFSNSGEYVELVVTPNPTAPLVPVNLEGWILDDNNVAASGQGNAIGHFVLGDCYQAVPPGSILVVYNPLDRNPDLPADDPTDADQDGVYIIPADDPCVEACNSNPSPTDSNYCPCADPNAPASAWQIGLRNPGDLFQVRDVCETVVHAISWGNIQVEAELQNSPVYIRIGGGNQSELVIRFNHATSDDWNDPANYDNPSVATGQTPGAANNAANANFILSLRNGSFGGCGGQVLDCKITDAGDLIAPSGITSVPVVICAGSDLDAFSANYDQPDEFSPSAQGFTFEYAFLLTANDPPAYPILDFNFSGDFDFSNLPVGNYLLWGFSYIQTNGSLSLNEFLSNAVNSIQDIRDFLACGYDADLDNLNPGGLMMEIQVVPQIAAVAPDDPLTACIEETEAVFDLTTYDALISAASGLPVSWYQDAGATQLIDTPESFASTGGQVFARLESGDCFSNIVSVDLLLGGNVNPAILIDQEPDCNNLNGAIRLEIANASGLNIDWNIDEWDGQSELTNLSSGNYAVTVSDAKGCRDSTSVELLAPDAITFQFAAIDPICDQPPNGAIELREIMGGTAPYELSFDGEGFVSTTNWSRENLASGEYTIILKDAAGCETNQKITLADAPILFLDVGPDLELQSGDSVSLVPTSNFPINDIIWAPTDGLFFQPNGLFLKPTETTTYLASFTTENGCFVSDTLHVKVLPPDAPPLPEAKVYIPNAISPNEDGINDRFTVFADEMVANIKNMRIFDRWGNLLFSRNDFAPNDLQQGWNGRSNDQTLNSGVYIYFIELEYLSGNREIFKGELNVLR